ncbi:MAG: hypothetical protein Q4B70_15160, partial [Lachnospiraceae bacterium]|nr:hypothetical protein [Lachnospiraceae bacterium]
MKRFTKLMIFLFACSIILLAGQKTEAADDVQIGNSSTQSGASQYTLAIGNSYWTETNGIGYVSFVTPAQEGYVNIEYKNLTISGWAYVYIRKNSGDTLGYTDRTQNNTANFEYKSEIGCRNGAKLEPNTRYYIQVGKNNTPGNAKLTVTFHADSNPNSKANAETVSLNTPYIRSIDSSGDADSDYFKFTATSSGAHHFTITNTTCNASLDYVIRKWNSDEIVKNSKGYSVSDYVYNGNTDEHDITLEAGQSYYLIVYDGARGNYSFTISNESVKGISMTSS